MQRLNIVYPAFNIDSYNWNRIACVLKPLSRHHNIQVFYYQDLPLPDVDWCTFKKVPAVGNICDLREVTRLATLILTQLDNFDVLYCWSSGAYFQLLNVVVAQSARKPIVMHMNGDAVLSRSHHYPNVAVAEMENTVDRLSLDACDLLIPISSILEKAIKPRIKNHERLSEPLPFTVDVTKFTPLPFPEEITVGYAGRISPEKGFPFYTQVIKETPSIKFRLAGPSQMSITYPENAAYHGCFSLCEMKYFYGMNSIITLPSFGEGMPAAILEAYACGRPILCTPESRPQEIPLFGYELEHDVKTWSKLINELNTDELLRLGQKARQWIENWFTWEQFGQKLAEKLGSVIKDEDE